MFARQAAVVALVNAILVFGVAGATQLACRPNFCAVNVLGPTVTSLAVAFVFVLVVVATRFTLLRATDWFFGLVILVVALGCGLLATLWAGVLATNFIGDHLSPWRETFLAPTAVLLVFPFDPHDHAIRWEGGEFPTLAELSLLTFGYAAASIGLAASAFALSRRHGVGSKWSFRALAWPGPTIFAALAAIGLLGYALVAVPAIAAEAESDAASAQLAIAVSLHLAGIQVAIDRFNVDAKGQPPHVYTAASMGSDMEVAYRAFDAALAAIRFPERALSDLRGLLDADAAADSASVALRNQSGPVPTLIQAFVAARDKQTAALLALQNAVRPRQH